MALRALPGAMMARIIRRRQAQAGAGQPQPVVRYDGPDHPPPWAHCPAVRALDALPGAMMARIIRQALPAALHRSPSPPGAFLTRDADAMATRQREFARMPRSKK